MLSLDWSQCFAVESIPGKVRGAWVFRDSRLLLTTDQRIRYQQNLSGRTIAIVVLTGTTKSSRVRLNLQRIAAVVSAATEVETPLR